jgi:putative transposase
MQTMTAGLPQGELPIARMCSLTGLSRAGYYRQWRASAPREEEVGVRDAIQRIALEHRYYGYRRIGAQLKREGFAVNHKRVLRLMRQDNLLCLRKRCFVPATTDSKHGWRVVPNLARFMEVSAIDQLWVADITYVRMREEFAYLAIIMDAFSRRVIGWALETHMLASLVIDALNMAISARRPLPGTLVHHSDRGTQYACGDYTAILNTHAILPSMSRVAYPYDNAKAESFMKTLKQEEVNAASYRNVHHARRQIKSFLEETYNHQRLHSALDYQSPVEFEAQMQNRIPGIVQRTKLDFRGMGKSTAMDDEVLLAVQ